MGTELIEKIVNEAGKLYIGESFKPGFILINDKGAEYELIQTIGKITYYINGELNFKKQTGTFNYYGNTFYFKYNKYGTVTDAKKPR